MFREPQLPELEIFPQTLFNSPSSPSAQRDAAWFQVADDRGVCIIRGVETSSSLRYSGVQEFTPALRKEASAPNPLLYADDAVCNEVPPAGGTLLQSLQAGDGYLKMAENVAEDLGQSPRSVK